MSIPFIDLKPQYNELKSSIQDRMQAVMEHGQFILGPEVAELEKQLAEFSGAPHVITCANGTDALVLAMMSLCVGPGDEVIVPGWSFIATAETVLLTGAKPVFVDIEKDTFNICPDAIEAAITDKTKAIIAVSLYGLPFKSDEVNSIAKKHGLRVIEDAAQSFGSIRNGAKSCNLSELATTSFYPVKPFGCYGDGGAVFTQNEDLAKELVSLRFHGMSETERYKHVRIGTNSRLDTLQAAVLLSKLERFPKEVSSRSKVGARYSDAFAGKLFKQALPEGSESVFAQYTIWLENRDEVRAKLQERGVPTAIHYPMPMYRQEAYRHLYQGEGLANCDWAAEGVMSLPMYPDLDEKTQDQVIAAVLEAI